MADTNSPKPKRRSRAKQPVKKMIPELNSIESKLWKRVYGLVKDALSTGVDSQIELEVDSWDLYNELDQENIEAIEKELFDIIEANKNNLVDQNASIVLVTAFIFAKAIIEHGECEMKSSFRSAAFSVVRSKGNSITFDKRNESASKEEKQNFFRDQLILEVVLSVLDTIDPSRFGSTFLSGLLSDYWKAELLFNEKIWNADVTESHRLWELIAAEPEKRTQYVDILDSIIKNSGKFISGNSIVDRCGKQLEWYLGEFFQQNAGYHYDITRYEEFLNPTNKKIFAAIFAHINEARGKKKSVVFQNAYDILSEKTNSRIALIYLLNEQSSEFRLDFGKFILSLNNIDQSVRELFEERPRLKEEVLKTIIEVESNGNLDEKRNAREFYKQHDPTKFNNRVNKIVNKFNSIEIEQSSISSEEINSNIAELFHFNTELAISTLVYKCADWMIKDINLSTINIIANRIKYFPLAVIPLVNVMGGHKDPDVFRKYLVETEIQKIEKIGIDPEILRLFWEGKLKLPEDSFLDRLKRWVVNVNLRSKTYMNLISDIDYELLQPKVLLEISSQVFELVVDKALNERILTSRRWASITLSQMSEPEFEKVHGDAIERLGIENNAHETNRLIKQNLETHAVPYISQYMDREEDPFIQKRMISVLMDVGGQGAKDAIVRVVSGTEKERDERQKMLSEYYLDPSKARSDQASELLDDAVKSAKRTMLLLQILNVATFGIGAMMLVGGAYYAIQASDDEMWKRITGFFTALGGLGAIVTIFLKDPLNRIQIAIGDLVQIQTAFTGFIWELNLNGTYIQSQYVAEGILTDFDIKQTVKRIDEAMDKSMHLIEQFTAEKGPEKPAYLTQLLPINGGLNSTITLLGQNLKSEDVPRRKVRYQVGINHQPTTHGYTMWSENQVVFQLSPELLEQYVGYQPGIGEAVWLSVFINGQETNALPFRIGEQQVGGYTNGTGGSWAGNLVSSFGGLGSLKSFLIKNQKDLPQDFDLSRLLEGTNKTRSLTKEKEGSEEKLATNNEATSGNNLGNFGKS